MACLSDDARRTLEACGCSEADISQVESLCTCGCTQEAIVRLRHYRAGMMRDLHDRQARLDSLDRLVRTMMKSA